MTDAATAVTVRERKLVSIRLASTIPELRAAGKSEPLKVNKRSIGQEFALVIT